MEHMYNSAAKVQEIFFFEGVELAIIRRIEESSFTHLCSEKMTQVVISDRDIEIKELEKEIEQGGDSQRCSKVEEILKTEFEEWAKRRWHSWQGNWQGWGGHDGIQNHIHKWIVLLKGITY